jgi:hypothetical protein
LPFGHPLANVLATPPFAGFGSGKNESQYHNFDVVLCQAKSCAGSTKIPPMYSLDLRSNRIASRPIHDEKK